MTSSWALVALMVGAGALIAFQSPINASLARNVGVFEAALVSFVIGAGLLLLLVLLLGKGDLRAVARVPAWQLAGGALGAAYITTIIVVVPRIGVASLMVTALAGQLATALLIDQMGWFGVQPHPLDVRRVAGLAFLFLAILLLNSRK
jgi:transporter family-2 protein